VSLRKPAASEANTRAVARRSLVAAQDITAGTRMNEDQIAIRRPGTGLEPAMLPSLVGLTAKEDIAAGTILSMEMFS
jgi:sialic acid synthase SpsE